MAILNHPAFRFFFRIFAQVDFLSVFHTRIYNRNIFRAVCRENWKQIYAGQPL